MNYQGYFIVGPDGLNLASSRDQNVGVPNGLLAADSGFLDRILGGQVAISRPVVADVPLPGDGGALREGLPAMFVGAPIHDVAGNIVAAFMFRLRPDEGFTGILQQGRIGRTGETYAFDRDGRLISASRYDRQLREAGVIGPEQAAMLNIRLLDPGANLVAGESATLPRSALPLTRMARAALRGESGTDVTGYRDYRGVPVVGAWRWEADLGLGIATEIDVAEAYGILHATNRTITALTALAIALVIGLTAIYLVYGRRLIEEATLREREALFTNLVEGVATDYLIVRQAFDGRVLYASPATERFAAVTADKAVGQKWWELLPVTRPELARVKRIIAAASRGTSPEPFDMEYRHPHGGDRMVEVLVRPEFDEQGSPFALLAVIKDVTDRHKTQQKLLQAATVFEHTDEGIIVTDVDRKIIAVNGAFTRITGYEEWEAVGREPSMLASERHDQAYFDEVRRTLDERGEWRGEMWNRRKNGEIYPVWQNTTVVRDEYGQVINYVALFSDISAIKESEERLAHLAHHDPLTGLANRLRFTANLEQALETAKRHQRKMALMYLDLDDFKPINDARGHSVGDEVLKLVAERLARCVRAEDTVARLGGDEFAIILHEITRSEDAAAVARKVLGALSEPLPLGEDTYRITASVGISIFPDDARRQDGLLRAADVAMDRAKESRNGDFEFHSRASASGGRG
jgi:diguanylate cyclase (GGDEF)-like protein/PAS domain S-box-containing protein